MAKKKKLDPLVSKAVRYKFLSQSYLIKKIFLGYFIGLKIALY